MTSKTQINMSYRNKTNKKQRIWKRRRNYQIKNTRKCPTHRWELPTLKGPTEYPLQWISKDPHL